MAGIELDALTCSTCSADPVGPNRLQKRKNISRKFYRMSVYHLYFLLILPQKSVVSALVTLCCGHGTGLRVSLVRPCWWLVIVNQLHDDYIPSPNHFKQLQEPGDIQVLLSLYFRTLNNFDENLKGLVSISIPKRVDFAANSWLQGGYQNSKKVEVLVLQASGEARCKFLACSCW